MLLVEGNALLACCMVYTTCFNVYIMQVGFRIVGISVVEHTSELYEGAVLEYMCGRAAQPLLL